MEDSEDVKTFGVARSDKWPAVRAAHLKGNAECAACGETTSLQVHHVQPFHVDKALELDPTNLITLCEGSDRNCHRFLGHLGNFKSINEKVRDDVAAWRARINDRPSWSGKEWQYPKTEKAASAA